MTPEQIELERKRREEEAARQKIAESRASATPITQMSMPLAAAGVQGPGMLQQMGAQIGKTMLSSLFGGLFNKGGEVPGNPMVVEESISVMGMPLGKPNGQATPIKKVQDMEKLDAQKRMDFLKEQQAERAFKLAESRKEQAHMQALAHKEEAHRESMRLKKESATIKTPLSKGD